MRERFKLTQNQMIQFNSVHRVQAGRTVQNLRSLIVSLHVCSVLLVWFYSLMLTFSVCVYSYFLLLNSVVRGVLKCCQ